MNEHEFFTYDRITKIQSTILKYGEDSFYISFSGGKDSTVLSRLVDLALPENKIPRVYADTGIEYKLVRDFVRAERERERSEDNNYSTYKKHKRYVGRSWVSV